MASTEIIEQLATSIGNCARSVDIIKKEGEVIPAGVTITYPDGTTEVLVEDYIVPAGEVYAVDQDEAICVPSKPLPPIEIPAEAFADPNSPTTEEVNTWVTANYPEVLINQHFWYEGTQSDPEYVFSADGDGSVHCLKEPVNKIQPTEFTNSSSDLNNPDCRTEIACDENGIFYGEAPHSSWIERQQAFVFGNTVASATLAELGEGQFKALFCLGPFEFTNPSPCRKVVVNGNFFFRGTSLELEAGFSGSFALDLLPTPALGLQIAQFYSASFENRLSSTELMQTGNISGSHEWELDVGDSTGPWYLCFKVNFNAASLADARVFADQFTNAPLARVIWHATTV